MNYLLGKYIAFASNDPRKYPKKPFLADLDKPRVMTAEEMERQARRITKKLNGTKN